MFSHRNSFLFLMFLVFTSVWMNHKNSMAILHLDTSLHESQQAGTSKRKLKNDFILDGSTTTDHDSKKLMNIVRTHQSSLKNRLPSVTRI